MKICIPFSDLPSRPGPGHDALNVALRPGGSLPEVLPSPVIVSEAGWRPLDGGVFFAAGPRIGVRGDLGVTQVAVAPDDVVALTPLGPDSALVFTASAIFSLSYRGGLWKLSPCHQPPFYVEVSASTPVTLSATVGPRTLSADYSREARLAPADLDAIGADLREAYDSVGAQAAAVGRFVQPVLVRWKLVDVSSGMALHTSPPLYVSAPGGVQGAALIGVDADTTDKGYTRLRSYSLSLEAYSLSVVTPDSDELAQAGLKVEVEVSPQLDPVDFSRPPVYHLNPRVTSGPLLYLALPATDSASFFLASAIGGVCDRWDSLASSWPPSVLSPSAASSGHTSLVGALAASPSASRVPPGYLSPNSFSAEGMCRSGNVVMWHGLRPRRFQGYMPRFFLSSGALSAATDAKAAVWVEFADGGRVLVEQDIPAGALWNPLLSFPDGSARRLVILIREGDRIRRLKLELASSPCGRMAFWLHPSGLPFSPVDEEGGVSVGYTLPVRIDAPAPSRLFCGCAPASDPLALSDVALVSAGRVAAIAPSPGSGSAWDFATPKFVAFCSDGIHALALAFTSGRPVIKGARLMDIRAVASRSAVCRAPDGIYALAAGHLVKVGRTGVVTLLPDLAPSAALGLCGSSLWVSTPDWFAEYDTASRRMVRRSLGTDPAPGFVMMEESPSGHLYALAGDGRMADLSESVTEPALRRSVPVEFSRRVDVCGIPRAVLLRISVPPGLADDLSADIPVVSFCSLRLKVLSAALPEAEPLLEVGIMGHVTSPLRFPVLAPPVTSLVLSLSGSVPAGATFHSITLEYDKYE